MNWGHSVSIWASGGLDKQTGVHDAQDVSVHASGDEVILKPIALRYRLEDLLANVTRRAMSDAFAWGPDVGRETVND